jgi:hypothetical protein
VGGARRVTFVVWLLSPFFESSSNQIVVTSLNARFVVLFKNRKKGYTFTLNFKHDNSKVWILNTRPTMTEIFCVQATSFVTPSDGFAEIMKPTHANSKLTESIYALVVAVVKVDLSGQSSQTLSNNKRHGHRNHSSGGATAATAAADSWFSIRVSGTNLHKSSSSSFAFSSSRYEWYQPYFY